MLKKEKQRKERWIETDVKPRRFSYNETVITKHYIIMTVKMSLPNKIEATSNCRQFERGLSVKCGMSFSKIESMK